MVDFFSGVYNPQDVQDEIVTLSLAHWDHREIKTLVLFDSIPWIFGKSVAILSQLLRDSVAFSMYVPSVLGPN